MKQSNEKNEDTNQIPKIILTGGGSGGHLFLLKSLVDYMRFKNFDLSNVLVVGSKLGMLNDSGKLLDEKLISDFGIKYELIRGGKLHRAWRKATIKLLWGILPGFLDSFRVIRNFRPDVIFAAGGYVTLPVVIVGKLLGKRIIIHEQTLTCGLTNKIASYFAHKILVTFPESLSYFPKHKSVVVGNVLRREILNPKDIPLDLENLLKFAKDQNKKIIYITGGSLGAHKINEFILANVDYLSKKYALVWQTGSNKYMNDFPKIQNSIKNLDLDQQKSIYLTEFIKEEIGHVYKNSDLVISRPGANTIYELASLGKRAILIPLGVTSSSDQNTNAIWFTKNCNGEIMDEKTLNLDDLERKIELLLLQPTKSNILKNTDVERKILDTIINR